MGRRRAITRWRDEVIARFRLRCANKEDHTIEVLRSGGLALRQHESDYRAWLVDDMRDRAGLPAESRCVALWRAWRIAMANDLEDLGAVDDALIGVGVDGPVFKRLVTDKARQAYTYARKLRAFHRARGVDWFTVPARERWAVRIRQLALAALHLTAYGEGFAGVAYGVHEGRNLRGDIVADPNGALRARVEVAIEPLLWFRRVWRRQLAVVEGVFVLDVLGQAPDGRLLAVAGRPSPRQFAVELADALVCPRTRRLAWSPSQSWRRWVDRESAK